MIARALGAGGDQRHACGMTLELAAPAASREGSARRAEGDEESTEPDGSRDLEPAASFVAEHAGLHDPHVAPDARRPVRRERPCDLLAGHASDEGSGAPVRAAVDHHLRDTVARKQRPPARQSQRSIPIPHAAQPDGLPLRHASRSHVVRCRVDRLPLRVSVDERREAPA